MKASFREHGFEHLPQFLSDFMLRRILRDIEKAATTAISRDFIMPGCGTPRYMKTLGGTAIRERIPSLVTLYESKRISKTVESIVGSKVFSCTHPEEFAVVNILQGTGQTHGWHLDDPDIALVLCLQAPKGKGGEVEMIRGFKPRQELTPSEVVKLVEEAHSRREVQTLSLRPGDAYLLHASTVLHRVNPLVEQADIRVALNFAYSLTREQAYGETANLLYGESKIQEAANDRSF